MRASESAGSVLRNFAELHGYQIKQWAEGLHAEKPFRVIRPDGTFEDFETSEAAIDYCTTDHQQTQEKDHAPHDSPGPEPPPVDH